MRSLRTIISAIVAISCALTTVSSQAQNIPVPKDANVAVRIDLAAIQDSKLGSKLMHAVRKLAAEEFSEEKKADDAFAGIEKALGFDPFKELRGITLFVQDVEDPIEGIQAVLEMGNTTGNLEGLLLALPGYDSSERGDHVIHSVAPDEDMRVYGSIHGSRNKHVVVATKESDVESMLDALDGSRSSSPSDKERRSNGNDALVTVRLIEIPEIEDLDGPPEALLKLIEDFSLAIRQYGDDLEVEINVESDTEKHAEQLQQLAQGAAAMVALARDVEEDDEDLKMVAKVLETLEVERDDTSIRASVKLDEDAVIEFLREEADLPLD